MMMCKSEIQKLLILILIIDVQSRVVLIIISKATSLDSVIFFFLSRRRHSRWNCDWSSDVCSSDLGNLAVAVPGIGRGDEVGEMAKAVEVFKSNAVARQSLEAEQRAAESRAVAGRKTDMNKVADEDRKSVVQGKRAASNWRSETFTE